MEFPSTHWSSLAVAARKGEKAAESALAEFYRRYREPVRHFIQRRGIDRAAGEDLTQDFFVHLIEKSTLSRADAARGRFRTFLLGVLVRFLGDRRDRDRAMKRGGGEVPVSLDAEDNGWATPATLPASAADFDREWAHQVLVFAMQALEEEYRRHGAAAEFAVLRAYVPGGLEPPSYEQAAQQLGITVGALKTNVHRLRERFRHCLRRELAATVATPDEVESEIAYLGSVLRQAGPMPASDGASPTKAGLS